MARPGVSAKQGAALLADDDESLNVPPELDESTASNPHKPANEALPESERPFGRYTLLRRLAYGGMGEIFLARQGGAGSLAPVAKLVVIKRILSHMRRDEKHRKMFLDEARLQALLNNQHVVQIYDMGEENGHVYLAMEHVHGPSWRSLIDRCRKIRRHIPMAHICQLVAQAARGLSYAHNLVDVTGSPLRIVHRDINPHNILVTYDGEVKLIDFGIAKSELADGHTETGTIKGKFSYMSPEQSAALPLDNRSDLFALGICLYELLTLENPFRKGNVVLSLESIQREAPPPVERKRRDAAAFQGILDRLLAKDKRDRFDDGAEIARALDGFVTAGVVPHADQPLPSYLRELFADEIAAHVQILEQTGSASALKVRSSSLPPSLAAPAGNETRVERFSSPGQNVARLIEESISGDVLPDPGADVHADVHAEVTAESQPTAMPGMIRQDDGVTSSTPAPLQTQTATPHPLRARLRTDVDELDTEFNPPSIADRVEPAVRNRVPRVLALAALSVVVAVGVLGAMRAGLLDRMLSRMGLDGLVAVVNPPRDPPPEREGPPQPVEEPPIDPPREPPPEKEPPGPTIPEREPPPDPAPEKDPPSPTEPELPDDMPIGDPPKEARKKTLSSTTKTDTKTDAKPEKVIVGTLLVTSEGYAVKGGRKLPLGGGTVLSIDDPAAPYELKLRVRADAEGNASFDVESEPWSIVRVDGVGRGKTPQKGVALAAGKRVEIELTNPKAGAMKVSLTLVAK